MDINRGLYPAPDGGFQSANPAAGIPNGSEVQAAFIDDIYFENINILSAAGVAPATATRTQVMQSLRRLLGGNVTTVQAASELTADNLGFIELNGDVAYSTLMPTPVGSLTPLIMVFNNTMVAQQLTTSQGLFDGPGGTNGTTLSVPANTILFLRSDGANYVVQPQFAALNGSLAQAFSVANASTAVEAAQFQQVPGGYGVSINAVTGSRALGVTYTNSAPRGIFVFVSGLSDGAGENLSISVDGVQVSIIGQTSTGAAMSVFAFVPAGSTYEVNGPNFNGWVEIV